MTGVWKNWLTVWCVGIGIFGLVLFGTGWSATEGTARAIFALFGNPFPIEPDRYLRFSTSLMGAVTLGWAVTLYAAFRAAWLLEDAVAKPVWHLLTLGIGTWYFIDSAASVANGFAANAISNTVLVIAYLVPVFASRALSGGTR